MNLLSYPAFMLMALMVIHPSKNLLNIEPGPSKRLHSALHDHSLKGNTGNAALIKGSGSYELWQLGASGLSKNAFDYAMKGFLFLSRANLITKKNIVSIVDYSKPSTQKRLYVIDIITGKILFNTWVAHGHNSGDEYASRFSNSPESHQSSLGFYITLNTYSGGHGYSLRLKGCEKGINDKAFERTIVVHGADYVSDRFINNRGMLGRSYGCPAIPAELSKEIIDVIKDGSCLFLYHSTKKYCAHSKILNSQV